MKRAIWIGVLVVLAFASILIVRFPAAWLEHRLPRQVACSGGVAGTLWDGNCDGLKWQGLSLGDLAWQLRPLRLLTGHLSLQLDLTRVSGFVRGDVELGLSGRIEAHDVHASLPIDHTLMPQLPPNLSGSMRADLSLLRVANNVIEDVAGRIEARDLEIHSDTVTTLGNYALSFPGAEPGKPPVGRLSDLGGPLSVDGTLTLTRQPGFALALLVAARRDAAPELVRQLEYLGTADASGRRPFSMSGTF